MSASQARPEILVVGAGLAGLTAAYHLRDRDVLVIEANDRVGGRTLSGEHDGGYWYNAGAQYVWDKRTVSLCAELGLEVMPAHRARSAIFARDRLAQASNPYALLLRMPLTLWEKAAFAATIARLRLLSMRQRGLDARLDARSLASVFGRISPITKEILDVVTESGTGLSPEEVSGAIGLGYAIHLFGGDVNSTLKAVRGGTQKIATAMAGTLGSERVVLGARAESVEARDHGVLVRVRRGNSVEQIESNACVVAVPARAARDIVTGLPEHKRVALEQMLPYANIVSVAWLTREPGPAPWDGLLAVPTLGLSFELFSHSAFFVRRLERRSRAPGGAFVTLSTASRADALWDLDDDAIRARLSADLVRMFPGAAEVIEEAETRITRWRGLPRFRRGWMDHQEALREPLDRIFFCGDYTAQPGTPGAVNSGYHVARSVREAISQRGALRAPSPELSDIR